MDILPSLERRKNAGQLVEKSLATFEGQAEIFLLNRVYVRYRIYQDYISRPFQFPTCKKKKRWNGEEREWLILKLSGKCKETSKSQDSFVVGFLGFF